MSKQSSNFRIGIDEERPDAVLRPKKKDNFPAEKLSRRITFLSILFFIMLGAAAFFIYTRFEQRLSDIEHSGQTGVTGLSREVAERFAALNEKYAGIEKKLEKLDKNVTDTERKVNKRVAPMNEIFLTFEKTTGNIEKKLKKIEKSLVSIKKNKSDKAELEKFLKTVNSIRGELKPLRDDLEKTRTRIGELEEKSTSGITETTEQLSAIKKGMGQLKSDIDTLSSGKIYQQVIDIAIKRQARELRREIRENRNAMREQESLIKSLRSRLDDLEKKYNKMKAPYRPGTTPVRKPASKPSSGTSATPPASGGIIEQNIE